MKFFSFHLSMSLFICILEFLEKVVLPFSGQCLSEKLPSSKRLGSEDVSGLCLQSLVENGLLCTNTNSPISLSLHAIYQPFLSPGDFTESNGQFPVYCYKFLLLTKFSS